MTAKSDFKGRELMGRVALVGAGPGDPDLLTLRAVRLLEKADVVVYDQLVSTAILNFVPVSAVRIDAGKRRNNHTMRQEDINALLVRLGLEGRQVVRLKGGDPFIFGRGGEELQALALAGVPFEVVPGITAASGVSCYAGIPLTHRNHAQKCVFVTGHLKAGAGELDWADLVKPHQTVVIFMGLSDLPGICAKLMQHGAPADKPVAVVQKGTTPDQVVMTGTLTTIAGQVAKAQLVSPCLIIVGEVVTLQQELAWFGR
jgi:uroporphyrin-III C-methyltransferase/precorrin-2 dehydrogenase/sirohydrochlorin ferrochelatase